MKKLLSVMMSIAIILGVVFTIPYNVTAAEEDEVAPIASASVPNDVYIKQQESNTCTLAAATNMIRARFYLSDNDEWKSATESAVHPVGWTNGMGLNGNFTYSSNGNSVSVNMGTVNGMAVASLKWLLDEHPEGVVIYSQSSQTHAVLVTDYVGDTFYCVDSDPGCASGRIPLASTVILGRYGSQANILANINKYWCIGYYNISPTNRRLDLGDDFYGLILHQPSWKTIGMHDYKNSSFSSVDNYDNLRPGGYVLRNVEIVSESQQSYDRTLWHFKRGSNNSYTITLLATGEKLCYCYNTSEFNVNNNVFLLPTKLLSENPYYNGICNDKWYFTQNGAGYSIINEHNTNLRMDLTGNSSVEGSNIQLYNNNNTDAQRFIVYQLNPNRDKLNYSITASKALLSVENQKSVITLGGSIPYAYSWKIHMVKPDGSDIVVVDHLAEIPLEYTGLSFDFELGRFVQEGVYTFYAEVTNPFGTERGSLTTKCVKVTVKYLINEGDFTYRVLEDGTAEITEYNGAEKDIVIPSTIAGKRVKSVSGLGENGKNVVESVVVSKGITNLTRAFYDCSKLKSVDIPEGVTDIYFAFYRCNELKTVVLPSSITNARAAFYQCENLETVTLSEGIKKISSEMFMKSGISFIAIPKSVTEIEQLAFAQCKNLKSIYIPESVQLLYMPKDGYHSLTNICPSLGSISCCEPCYVETVYGVPGSMAEQYVEYSNRECGTNIQFVDINTETHEEVIEKGKPATCTESGISDKILCSNCGQILQDHEYIPALGHEYKIIQGTPATYWSTGLTNGVQCTRCGEWLIQPEVIPKLEGGVLFGDVNGDNNVDVLDAAAIQKHASGISELNSDQLAAADVNGDGNVDVLDAADIQKFAAGIISEFKKKA